VDRESEDELLTMIESDQRWVDELREMLPRDVRELVAGL
jgi:hypothetical protein